MMCLFLFITVACFQRLYTHYTSSWQWRVQTGNGGIRWGYQCWVLLIQEFTRRRHEEGFTCY